MEKFITSHKTRVAKAEAQRKNSGEEISIFDREAFVEFYLLEDVLRLYEHRLQAGTSTMETRAGAKAREATLAKFQAIIDIFKASIEIAENEIRSGNYKAVWKSIPEHQLMRAASSLKNLPKLREIAVDMLKGLSDEMLIAVKEAEKIDEGVDSVEIHEKNMAAYNHLSLEKIEEVIKTAEAVIPSAVPKPNVSRLNKI